MPAKTPPTRRAGRLIGYARVSSEARGTDPQADELRAAGCEQLEGQGAHFRSLRDPIDTTTPQGMFSLQVLGRWRSSSEH